MYNEILVDVSKLAGHRSSGKYFDVQIGTTFI